ncbi:MAG: dihydroorotate dehydrogenase electron transfer subunit [Phycisphaerae bacterium]
MNEQNDTNRGSFNATVVGNRQIGKRFYKLLLQFDSAGAAAFAKTKPGQFAEIDPSRTALPAEQKIPEDMADAVQREIILRRPYSFCDVISKDNKTAVEILYCVVGPASIRLTTLKESDTLSIIGPLGNGFCIPQNKKIALLVSGGMGAPPILHLAKIIGLENPMIQAIAFVGAKTKMELPFEGRIDEVSKEIGFPVHAFAQYGVESQIATDDGSLGFAGPITKCLTEWLDKNPQKAQEAVIFACGPEAMLAEVARIANEKNIDCQVSMERRMACGIGVCQSCTVECKTPNSTETVYKLCCKDGPVFDAKEVVFSAGEHRI